MKNYCLALAGIMFVALCGCATTSSKDKEIILLNYIERTTYDKSADFNADGVFNWYKVIFNDQTPESEGEKIVQNAIKRAFLRKDFYHVKSKSVTYFVNYYFSRKNEVSDRILNRSYRFLAPKIWIPGLMNPAIYGKDTLIIDIINTKTLCPVWRGTIQMQLRDNLSNDRLEQTLISAANKLLSNYPPEKKEKVVRHIDGPEKKADK